MGLKEDVLALQQSINQLAGDDDGDAAVKTATKSQNRFGRAQAIGKGVPAAAPHARRGEDPMSSRGYSFCRMAAAQMGWLDPDNLKIEVDINDRLESALEGVYGRPYDRSEQHSAVCPIGVDYLPDIGGQFVNEMKSLLHAGVPADHTLEQIKEMSSQAGFNTKTMSWLNELTGGTFIAPPAFGEPIELLRNLEAFINAGARVIPLPPQGRIVFPRLAAATQGGWSGENTALTESTPGTGKLTLSAKKVGGLVTMPNELIRFGGPAAEAIVRLDLMKTLSLVMDKGFLEGKGSDVEPEGLLTMSDVNVVTPSTQAANGDSLAPQDWYQFIAKVESKNAQFEAWIIRPEMWWGVVAERWISTTNNDKGGFVFNLTRGIGDGFPEMLANRKVVKTNQVSKSRTQGNATNLTYAVGGMFSDYYVGIFGAIEFLANPWGDTAFGSDQTKLRAILHADGGPRHPAAFSRADHLIIPNGFGL